MIQVGVWAVMGVAMLVGPAACSTTTIDDVARSVGKADDSAFKKRLTEINGGNVEVGDDLAEQLNNKSAMVEKIIGDSDQAVSFACTAFKGGYESTVTDAGRRYLAEMRDEVSRGKVTAE